VGRSPSCGYAPKAVWVIPCVGVRGKYGMKQKQIYD